MEKEYYIVRDNNRVGPMTFEQLAQTGIEPSTLVWTAGMADWARADSMPELEPLLARNVVNDESAFGSYVQPDEPPRVKRPWEQQSAGQYGQQRQFGQAQNGNGNLQVKTNWKTLSIVAMVAGFIFSCIGGIVGIFALLEANKAENMEMAGFEQQAQRNWSNCKTLTIISFVLVGLGLIGNVLVMRYSPSIMHFSL